MNVRLLYRRMFREIFYIFLLCMGIFVSIILIGRLIQMGKVLVSLDLSLLDIVRLIVYLSPFFLFVLIPVCGMLALFLTFQRMSTDHELIALRSGGISLKDVLPCPIFFLILICLINFLVSFYGISWGMENFNSHLIELAKKKARLSLRPGIFNTDIRGFTIYTQRLDEKKDEVGNIFIEQKNVQQGSIIIIGPRGYLKWDPEKKELYFSIINGKIYERDKVNRLIIISFKRYDLRLDLKKVFRAIHIDTKDPKFKSFKDIEYLIHHSLTHDKYYTCLVEEMHKRIAIPISCIVLGLLAIPMGWILEGMKKFYGSIVILLMFLGYYAFFALGKSLVEGGAISPVMGIWAPNVIFFFLTLVVFFLAQKEKLRLSTRD